MDFGNYYCLLISLHYSKSSYWSPIHTATFVFLSTTKRYNSIRWSFSPHSPKLLRFKELTKRRRYVGDRYKITLDVGVVPRLILIPDNDTN